MYMITISFKRVDLLVPRISPQEYDITSSTSMHQVFLISKQLVDGYWSHSAHRKLSYTMLYHNAFIALSMKVCVSWARKVGRDKTQALVNLFKNLAKVSKFSMDNFLSTPIFLSEMKPVLQILQQPIYLSWLHYKHACMCVCDLLWHLNQCAT